MKSVIKILEIYLNSTRQYLSNDVYKWKKFSDQFGEKLVGNIATCSRSNVSSPLHFDRTAPLRPLASVVVVSASWIIK